MSRFKVREALGVSETRWVPDPIFPIEHKVAALSDAGYQDWLKEQSESAEGGTSFQTILGETGAKAAAYMAAENFKPGKRQRKKSKTARSDGFEKAFEKALAEADFSGLQLEKRDLAGVSLHIHRGWRPIAGATETIIHEGDGGIIAFDAAASAELLAEDAPITGDILIWADGERAFLPPGEDPAREDPEALYLPAGMAYGPALGTVLLHEAGQADAFLVDTAEGVAGNS